MVTAMACPMSLVEAQSQCLPVLSTPISGIPELIENGVNGVLVEPNSPQQLASALIDMSADPTRRSQMGNLGADKVHESFNAANEINLLLELLRDGERSE